MSPNTTGGELLGTRFEDDSTTVRYFVNGSEVTVESLSSQNSIRPRFYAEEKEAVVKTMRVFSSQLTAETETRAVSL